jgi:hypothetical protein
MNFQKAVTWASKNETETEMASSSLGSGICAFEKEAFMVKDGNGLCASRLEGFG